jgi:DNA-binding PadR family transcriptional regulator
MSVPHALLALLSEGPEYGLRLREEFEARTGKVWPLNVGQVYKTLGRLERDGLAESEDGAADGPQKRFRITPAVEAELAAWLRTPPDLTSPPRDEPSGALDSVSAEEVMSLLHEACRRGAAAVALTHDARLASWADRVLFLRDGRFSGQTSPSARPELLLTDPEHSR